MGCCASTPEEHQVDIERKADKTVKVGEGATAKTSAHLEEETTTLQARRYPDHAGAFDPVIEEYSNATVNEIARKLGPFQYPSGRASDQPRTRKEVQQLENGARYVGEWNDATGERDGQGVQIWSDGSRYEGLWRCDKANGVGRLIHADGDVYEGEWLDDKAHGKGVYMHMDGARYDGDWKEDKQDGYGVETWPDGAKY